MNPSSAPSDPLPEALKFIQSAIARHQAYVAEMQAVETMIRETMARRPVVDQIAPPVPRVLGKKAPAGTLKSAILKVLAMSKDPLGNMEVRDAVAATGYGYSLSASHVGKTLGRLAATRKVRRDGENSGSKYSLAVKAR
jgi:hypothetical protein